MSTVPTSVRFSKVVHAHRLQSSLPSCHLRGKERYLRATFVKTNASSTCYRRNIATILPVVRPGRNRVGDLAALIKKNMCRSLRDAGHNLLKSLEIGDGLPLTRIIRTHSCSQRFESFVATRGVQAPVRRAPPLPVSLKGSWLSCPMR